MRAVTVILALLMVCHPAHGFFLPLTTEQRIANSTLIAVIEVKRVNNEKGQSIATVIQAILGTKAGQSVEVWDDWQIDASGSESRIAGRDPDLAVSKRYLIYLTKNQKGRLVTVQSSLDCIEVNGDRINKEGQKSQALEAEIASIQTLITKKRRQNNKAGGNWR